MLKAVVVILIIAVAWLLYIKKETFTMYEARGIAKDVVKKGGKYIDFVARVGSTNISPLQFIKLAES
jgi:hypothetical protein